MPGILCEHCTALCCRYIALPIDTPTDREDLDFIRWYLIHQNVSVFVEDGDWYISFQSTCRHLLPDNRCGIYDTRPQICRKYTTENCDYHSGDYGWEHHFTCAEHLDEYVRVHWRKRGKRSHSHGSRAHKIHAERHGRAAGQRRPRLGLSLAKARQAASFERDRQGVPLPVLANGRLHT